MSGLVLDFVIIRRKIDLGIMNILVSSGDFSQGLDVELFIISISSVLFLTASATNSVMLL